MIVFLKTATFLQTLSDEIKAVIRYQKDHTYKRSLQIQSSILYTFVFDTFFLPLIFSHSYVISN